MKGFPVKAKSFWNTAYCFISKTLSRGSITTLLPPPPPVVPQGGGMSLHIRPSVDISIWSTAHTQKRDLYSYFEKGCRRNCARDNPRRWYGIWSMHFSWHCSCRIYFCCFPLALANILPWLLVSFSEISLKNSELKITHNTFRDCRVHFFRQPFLK